MLKAEGYLNGRPLTLYSGNYELLKEVQGLTDKILIRPSTRGDYEYMAQYLNPPLVNIGWKMFSKELIDQIHKDGRKAFVNCLFTADKKKNIQKAIAAGADYIQSDKQDVLIKLVNNYHEKQKGLPE